MSLISKSLFTLLSVSALIYLVLQTRHGQEWSNRTQDWALAKPLDELTLSTSKRLPGKMDENELLALNNFSSEELHKIILDAKDSISSVAQLRSEIEELRLSLRSLSTDIQNAHAHIKQMESNDKILHREFAEISSRRSSAEADKTKRLDENPREQQARLKDIVQRMELTALQAISK